MYKQIFQKVNERIDGLELSIDQIKAQLEDGNHKLAQDDAWRARATVALSVINHKKNALHNWIRKRERAVKNKSTSELISLGAIYKTKLESGQVFVRKPHLDSLENDRVMLYAFKKEVKALLGKDKYMALIESAESKVKG